MIALTLRNYLSRFGWEIAAFWTISIGNTILLERNGPTEALRAMAVLEIVALAWITVRLVLAEDGFKTSGGWQTRPFSHQIRLGLPLALAVVVAVFPAVVRAFAFQRMFDGASIWSDFSPGSWWRQVGNWFFFFVLPLKTFGLVILQGIEGRARTAAWATLALILLPLLLAFSADFGQGSNSLSGSNDPRELAQGIQQKLPDATDFIGAWNDMETDYGFGVPTAKRIATFRINPDASPAGVSVRFAVGTLRGSRVNISIHALFDDNALASRLKNAIAILRYADGTCATCPARALARPGTPLPFFPASGWEFTGDFVSPLSLPEFDGDRNQLTRGVELMFFDDDSELPRMPADSIRAKVAGQNRPFRFSPKTMDELFVQFPWSDDMWRNTAGVFLMKHATRADIPFLLDRMLLDPRIATLFLDKHWELEALPMLWQLAEKRVPLSSDVILLLAEQKVAERSADLAAVALQLKSGLSDVEMSLRAQPGFDWPAFAKELWQRKKYTTNWLQPHGEFWLTALWAAREGDFTAFRETAEQAASGKKWESEHLTDLVAGDHEDLIGYLRDNIARMKFDPKTRKWR